jgi:hypothetical protein
MRAMTTTARSILWVALVLGCAIAVSACSDNDQTTIAHDPDMQVVSDAAPPDLRVDPSVGRACTNDNDCNSPFTLCEFPVADGCSAVGHCRLSTSPCTAVRWACGCNGQMVISGACEYDDGYAAGPVIPGGNNYPDCPVDGGQ